MELFPKVAAFAVGGIGLLSINIWFIQLAIRSFGESRLPQTISPVSLLGSADKDSLAGQALAGMLLGRLGKIREEMAATLEQLRTPLAARRGISREDVRPIVNFPTDVLQPLVFEMKVGGVEVGGVLSWLHRALTSDNSLRLAVENVNGRAVVSGSWNDGNDTLWVEISGDEAKPISNERIASTVAYALAQRQFESRVSEIRALTIQEFERLLIIFGEVAALNKQVAWGRAGESDFATYFERIEPIVTRTPKWKEVVHFGARLADRGGKTQQAIHLYQDTLDLLVESDSELRPEIEKRIKTLSETLVDEAPAPVAWPLSAMGVSNLRMPAPVRIAVIGGVPTDGTLPKDRIEVLGVAGANPTDSNMAEYVRTVVQAVELVAPNTAFVFAQSERADGGYSSATILDELVRLASARPEIILITLGPFEGAMPEMILHRLRRDAVVVLPAGTNRERVPFEDKPIAKYILAAASVGKSGTASRFTSIGNTAVWAPGEAIPLRPTGRDLQPRDGTVYSAALVAGVAARVMAEYPGIRPERLVGLLKDSAQRSGEGTQAVINLDNALKLAKASAEAAAAQPAPVTALSTPDRFIPDNSRKGIEEKLQLGGDGQVGAITVSVDIEHDWIGDLRVRLVAPDGRSAVLHDRGGGSGRGLRLDLESPFDTELSPLLGAPLAGEWKLLVNDLAGGNTGRLKQWSLAARMADK